MRKTVKNDGKKWKLKTKVIKVYTEQNMTAKAQ